MNNPEDYAIHFGYIIFVICIVFIGIQRIQIYFKIASETDGYTHF